jgi:hypothetical protein
LKDTLHFPLQFRGGRIQHLAPRIEDDAPRGCQPIEMEADRFADTPFDAVANHRLADGTGKREADPWTRRVGVPQAEGSPVRPAVAGTVVVDSAKFAGTQQADTFGKTGYESCLSELTVSFFRPRARRREITARPSWVFMRTRNPCVFARLRLFG